MYSIHVNKMRRMSSSNNDTITGREGSEKDR